MKKEVFETKQDLGEATLDATYDIEEQEAELRKLNRQINLSKLIFVGVLAITCIVLLSRMLYG